MPTGKKQTKQTHLTVSQTSLSVSAPEKKITTVINHKKKPKMKMSPREAERRPDPHFLTDPPVPPQHPSSEPINTNSNNMHKMAMGTRRT